jgi:hypothetical protein
MSIDTDRAYLYGLIVGGGLFGNDQNSFVIQLPYKKWGSFEKNPERAGEIATSIVECVKPLFESLYGITCSYGMSKGKWLITCSGSTKQLRKEFLGLGITLSSEIRKTANIEKLVENLKTDISKNRFLAGLADTIGSLAESQRRFTEKFAIISFEFNGFNYDLAYRVCRLLASMGMYSDQIEWNHPNQQAGQDPCYDNWKKGFKVRVPLDEYAAFGKFAFSAKAHAAKEVMAKQKGQVNHSIPCSQRPIHLSNICVHPAENSPSLPNAIRGGHFVCQKHYCALMGCPFAPADKIATLLRTAGQHVVPFPIIHKDTLENIQAIISNDDFYRTLVFQDSTYTLKAINDLYQESNIYLMFHKDKKSGYPINYIRQALAYIIATEKGLLNGKRVAGNQNDLISKTLMENPTMLFTFKVPDLLSILIVTDGTNGAIIGAENPLFYQKLTSITENGLKLIARKPTREDYEK